MSTIEQKELQSSNGWQNIGICVKYARNKNIPDKLFSSYIMIVEESFGYCNHVTKRISFTEWAKKLNVARTTVIRNFKELEELKLIKKFNPNKYLKDGGSEAFCYAPDYPETFGKIKFKDNTNSGSAVLNKHIEPEREWNKEKNIDF